MLFIISKLVDFMTSPINWIFGLLLLAVFIHNKKIRKWILWGTLLVGLIFTNGDIKFAAYQAWAAPFHTPLDTTVVYDMAIVLGGSTSYSQKWGQIDYNEAADRMTEAIRLYRLGRIKKMLVSGDQAVIDRDGITYTPYFLAYMEQMGVKKEDILVEQKARTTKENILYIKEMVARYNLSKVLLITSGIHMRRSMKGSKAAGLNLVPYAVDIFTGDDFSSWTDFLPEWKNAEDWHQLIHEMVGMAVIS